MGDNLARFTEQTIGLDLLTHRMSLGILRSMLTTLTATEFAARVSVHNRCSYLEARHKVARAEGERATQSTGLRQAKDILAASPSSSTVRGKTAMMQPCLSDRYNTVYRTVQMLTLPYPPQDAARPAAKGKATTGMFAAKAATHKETVGLALQQMDEEPKMLRSRSLSHSPLLRGKPCNSCLLITKI